MSATCTSQLRDGFLGLTRAPGVARMQENSSSEKKLSFFNGNVLILFFLGEKINVLRPASFFKSRKNQGTISGFFIIAAKRWTLEQNLWNFLWSSAAAAVAVVVVVVDAAVVVVVVAAASDSMMKTKTDLSSSPPLKKQVWTTSLIS